jgi:hypothetical protein
VFNHPTNGTDPEGLRVPAAPPVVRPTPLPFPGRPRPGPYDPYWPPGSPPSASQLPLPYPCPTPLPPGYRQGPGPCLEPQPGTQEWEAYARACWRRYRVDCRNDPSTPACPQPGASIDQSVHTAANDFLAQLQSLGIIPNSVTVRAVNCRPVQVIPAPNPICGGQPSTTIHCKALVTSNVGGWVSAKDVVSVFVCPCCDRGTGTYSAYAKPLGTPSGQGKPHLPGGNEEGDISK